MGFDNINLLDCSLRDGGHVNNAYFGKNVIKSIIKNLNQAGTELIEIGFLKNGNFSEDEANYTTIEEAYNYLPEYSKSEYSVMIRPDWYDIKKLSPCDGRINYIRFAFYYKDIKLTKEYCKIVKDYGYKFFLNPVNIIGYSDLELGHLIDDVNEISPNAFTMVDTFGALTETKLVELYNKIETLTDDNLIIDLHLHENLNSAFSLAKKFLEIKKKERKVFLDASLYGIGRIPGNLCIELIMDYLNDKFDKIYDIDFVLELIDNYIETLKNKYKWGYSPAYYYTGKFKIHRSYAEYLLTKDLSLLDIKNILLKIKDKSDMITFNKDLADKEYSKYMKERN